MPRNFQHTKGAPAERAQQLLEELGHRLEAALSTARELQLPVDLLGAQFHGGRVRGVIDQLLFLRLSARDIGKGLKRRGEVSRDN